MGILTAFVGEPDHVPSDHLFELRWRDYPKATEEPRLQRPPPVGMLFPANEWPIDDFEEAIQELGDGEAWWAQIAGTFFRDNPYEADPAADRKPRKTFLYRPGTAPLQRPEIGRDEPFRAIARLWNWQTNDRHREQMRRPWPKFAFHGEGCRVDRDLPRAFPDDLGGRCCRWTCWGFKTCPLQCWKRQK
jgi:hypothetical protein